MTNNNKLKNIIDSGDALEQIIKEFEKSYTQSHRLNIPFKERIKSVLDGETYTSFAYTTELSPNMLYRIKNVVDEKDPPQRKTLMSICVGYQLDLMTTLSLFDSLGLSFNVHNRRDYAYCFLLTRCRGMDIPECNEVLDALGIEKRYWLGSRERSGKVA